MATRLLIVETESELRDNLVQRMRLEKYQVFAAHELSQIKRLIKKERIDVVLLSLVELKREGLEILSAIKQFRPSLEVILINNSEAMALSIEGMKRGAFDDFFQPLEMNQLWFKIEEAAERHKQRAKIKKPFRQRYEEIMIAISLAESGSPELAHDYLNREAVAAKESKGPSDVKDLKDKDIENQTGRG